MYMDVRLQKDRSPSVCTGSARSLVIVTSVQVSRVIPRKRVCHPLNAVGSRQRTLSRVSSETVMISSLSSVPLAAGQKLNPPLHISDS